MRDRIVWLGRHEGLMRDVSRGCAYGDTECLKKGALLLSSFVPAGSVIIPMPSHIGYATTMLSLCNEMKKINGTYEVRDCLKCIPHQSNHIIKLHGDSPKGIIMYQSAPVFDGSGAFIIDNCIGSGCTAGCALEIMHRATVIAITKG